MPAPAMRLCSKPRAFAFSKSRSASSTPCSSASTARLIGARAAFAANAARKPSDDASVAETESGDGVGAPQPPPTEKRIERRGARRGRFVSDETRSKMSRAKEGKVMPFETRLKISGSTTGLSRSKETRERMAEARRAYWAAKRREKKREQKEAGVASSVDGSASESDGDDDDAAAPPGRRRRGEPGSDADETDDDEDSSLDPSSSLDLERAVAELSALRSDVTSFVADFARRSGGRTPTREEVAAASPEVYRKFIRFVALQDFVRRGRGPR